MSNSNVIQSTKSNTVKTIQALLHKRKRRTETNTTIVEGPRMVIDLLRNPNTKHLVQQVLVSTEKKDWIQELRDLQIAEEQLSSSTSFRLMQATPQVLTSCSDTVTPQGIVAIVSIPDYEEQLVKSNKQQKQEEERQQYKYPMYLVLDGVSDPGNVGTLLRSAVAVGAKGVLLLPHSCDVWNPKAVRSAMGCTFQIPIRPFDSWKEAHDFLQEQCTSASQNDRGRDHELTQCAVYAATMDTSCSGDDSHGDSTLSSPPSSPPLQSIPYYDVDWTAQPSALVIGSEGKGLCTDVRQAVANGSIQPMHVPMEPGIESLNAAVCGSVVLFEYLRQCRTAQTS